MSCSSAGCSPPKLCLWSRTVSENGGERAGSFYHENYVNVSRALIVAITAWWFHTHTKTSTPTHCSVYNSHAISDNSVASYVHVTLQSCKNHARFYAMILTQDLSRLFLPITCQIMQEFCKNHDKILIRKNWQDLSYIILLKLARSLEILQEFSSVLYSLTYHSRESLGMRLAHSQSWALGTDGHHNWVSWNKNAPLIFKAFILGS